MYMCRWLCRRGVNWRETTFGNVQHQRPSRKCLNGHEHSEGPADNCKTNAHYGLCWNKRKTQNKWRWVRWLGGGWECTEQGGRTTETHVEQTTDTGCRLLRATVTLYKEDLPSHTGYRMGRGTRGSWRTSRNVVHAIYTATWARIWRHICARRHIFPCFRKIYLILNFIVSLATRSCQPWTILL